MPQCVRNRNVRTYQQPYLEFSWVRSVVLKIFTISLQSQARETHDVVCTFLRRCPRHFDLKSVYGLATFNSQFWARVDSKHVRKFPDCYLLVYLYKDSNLLRDSPSEFHAAILADRVPFVGSHTHTDKAHTLSNKMNWWWPFFTSAFVSIPLVFYSLRMHGKNLENPINLKAFKIQLKITIKGFF